MPPKKGQVRAGSGLQKLLSDKPSQFLLYAVETVQDKVDHRRAQRVLKHLKARHEAIGWVHVSDLLKDCDRHLAARLLGYQFKEEAPGPKLSRIFENGHFMHIRWQNAFLSLPPEYSVQLSHIVQRWPVIGEADITVRHPSLGKIVVELKSINDNGFREVKKGGAQFGHLQQVSCYAHLFTELEEGGPEPWTAQIWYENKNDQEVATFDPEVQRKWVGEQIDRAVHLAEIVSEGKLPKPCPLDCPWDERVGNIKGPKAEARMMRLKEWYDQYRAA